MLVALKVEGLHCLRIRAEEILRATLRGQVVVITGVLGDLQAEITVIVAQLLSHVLSLVMRGLFGVRFDWRGRLDRYTHDILPEYL